MLRIVLTRRWAVRIVGGMVLAAAFVALGMWQLDRNEQRQARNAVIEENLARDPLPVGEVLSVDGLAGPSDRWTPVRVSGTYDTANELVIRLRPLDGQRGVHVLTPLVTDDGAAVLVDRGFVPSAGAEVPEVPAAASGEVEVTGRVRPSEVGRGTGGDPASGAIRYVDVAALAEELPYPLYGGWVELTEQRPPAAAALEPLPPPEIDAGPHLSYAIQWFAFAVIGIGGFVMLVRTEARLQREDEQRAAREGVTEERAAAARGD